MTIITRRRLLTGAAGAAALPFARSALAQGRLTVTSYGGTWEKAQREIYAPVFKSRNAGWDVDVQLGGPQQWLSQIEANASAPPIHVSLMPVELALAGGAKGLFEKVSVDKVPNRFELVLLAAHRARSIADGSAITVPVNDDKNPVIALREIADRTIPPEDMRESLIHSIQKNVEVDEPEPSQVPLIGAPGASVDADDTEVTVERMTEEELLKGLEGLAPPEEQPEEEE